MSAVTTYVQQREGEFFVGNSSVTLHSVIANWKRGDGPERIQEAFPSLPLVAIYGAITYYLEHQPELDRHFRETVESLAAHQAQVEAQHPEFFADMRARIAKHRATQDNDIPEQSK